MIRNYDDSLQRLLAHEGGYTNHPQDPGGPTNFGITIADYRKYVMPNAEANDVRGMKLIDAKTIYKAKYWDATRCTELPDGVDYCIFDYGVNSGIGRAGKVLRRLVGLPDNTSLITDDVIAAVMKRKPADLCAAICDERLKFLKGLKTWPTFGPGWGRRVVEVRAHSIELANRAPAADMRPLPQPAPSKAVVPTPQVPAAKKGAAIGGGIGYISLLAWSQSHPFEAFVAFAASVLAIYAGVKIFKRWLKSRQEAPVAGVAVVPVIQGA